MSVAVPDAVTVDAAPPRSDAELVKGFVSSRDETAFAELVRRHSGLVLGVCGRVLHNAHDIEDVFQATFLVFVRDANRVKKQQSLASWFYGVAYRLALHVARQRQRRRETVLVDESLRNDEAIDEVKRLADWNDRQLMCAELEALPDRYRRPLLLRYFAGKPPREVAKELGISVGAVDGLIARGKNELRNRLVRRGVALSAALLGLQLSQRVVHAGEAETLVDMTVQTGVAWKPGSQLPDLISDWSVELTGKELIAMTTLAKSSIPIGLTIGTLALGWGGVGRMLEPRASQAQAGVVTTLNTTIGQGKTLEVAAFNADEQPKDEPSKAASAVPATEDVSFTAPGAKITATSAGATYWDFKARSPIVQRIEQGLQDPTEVAFSDNPLEEALSYLEDLHNIEIWIDKPALEEAGVAPDTPVSLVMSRISLKNALHLILEPMELDYVIHNEVLKITSRAKADSMLETRVYNVSRLPHLPPRELVDVITATVEPSLWIEEGGPGTARAATNTLVIRQTQRVHEEIVELLNQLEQQSTNQPKSADRPKPIEPGDAVPKPGSLELPSIPASSKKPGF